jgi:hypothetical protein
MQHQAWYPYAADQAFGRQAARDEELIEQLVARLDGQPRNTPRAGNKAPAVDGGPMWRADTPLVGLLAEQDNDGPVTTAAALDAAPLAQRRPL